jgi:hypothetical protein
MSENTDYLKIVLQGITEYGDALSVFYYDQYKKSGDDLAMYMTGMRKAVERISWKIDQAEANAKDSAVNPKDLSGIRVPGSALHPAYVHLGWISRNDVARAAMGLKMAWNRVKEGEDVNGIRQPAKKAPVIKITNPVKAAFCILVNDAGTDKKDLNESIGTFTKRVCSKYGMEWADKVRQNYGPSACTKGNVKKVKERVLPLIPADTAKLINTYIDNGQNLYG